MIKIIESILPLGGFKFLIANIKPITPLFFRGKSLLIVHEKKTLYI